MGARGRQRHRASRRCGRQAARWCAALHSRHARFCATILCDPQHCAGDFIAEAKTYGIDFGSHNFVHFDRSGPEYLAASFQTLLKNARAKGAVFDGR